MDPFLKIYQDIILDPANQDWTERGALPIYTAGKKARIALIGQAPGRRAEEHLKPWSDKSGEVLLDWLGITKDQFYNPDIIAILPIDFYFPGKGTHGDLPPRASFAEKWHSPLLALMPDIKLTLLVGSYAQKFYLTKNNLPKYQNLTETIQNYQSYLPNFFPLVHPSPLNFRWQSQNPWFKKEVIPALQKTISRVL